MLENSNQSNKGLLDDLGGTTEVPKTSVVTATLSTVDSTVRKEAVQDIPMHFGIPVRLGSRTIQVMQVPKFSLLPKGPEARSIRAEQVKKIGSEWKRGTRDIIRGLTDDEEVVYLPKILGTSPEDNSWNDKVKTYWADFGMEIPYEDGIELEVGFKKNLKGVVEPISLDGYIKYNYCKEYSRCATTDEQLENPINCDFYVVDKAKAKVDEEERFTIMKNVNRIFDQLVAGTDDSSRNKIVWILETMGGEDGVGINTTNLSTVQKEMELEKFKNRNPGEFTTAVNDSNIETKALIRKAIETSTLSQEGNSIFFNNKCIGNTLLDAVGYLTNPVNQGERLMIIQRIKSVKQ